MKPLLTLALLLTLAGARGQNTATTIFDPSFASLKVQRIDNFFAPPILTLGEEMVLAVTFDRLHEDRDYLRFRLLHCDAYWRPSQLVESEYLDTFNDVAIDDYAFSQNTFRHYVNYRIEISPQTVMPLLSGNYLLQVYDESDPDETLLQTRFSVEEPLVEISASASARTDRGINDTYQQLFVELDTHRQQLRDPFNDIVLTIDQNLSPWGTTSIPHPQRVESDKIIYEHQPQLIFRAGNEYRRFETVRADYPGMNIDSVRYMGHGYHAWVHPEGPKRNRSYVYDQTQNGRFMVREYNATDSDLGADYITVHFSLPSDEIIDADVYLDGEATLGAFTDINRMTYDRQERAYKADIPLKQGSYNYRYVVVPRNGAPDPYFLDGDKYETRNEYVVRAYMRRPGDKYDRLIGYTYIINQ